MNKKARILRAKIGAHAKAKKQAGAAARVFQTVALVLRREVAKLSREQAIDRLRSNHVITALGRLHESDKVTIAKLRTRIAELKQAA